MSEKTSTESTVNLQLSDLVSVLEILQLASARGTFKPEEFTTIGGVYERIYAFLESTGAVVKPEAPQSTQGNQS